MNYALFTGLLSKCDYRVQRLARVTRAHHLVRSHRPVAHTHPVDHVLNQGSVPPGDSDKVDLRIHKGLHQLDETGVKSTRAIQYGFWQEGQRRSRNHLGGTSMTCSVAIDDINRSFLLFSSR